MSSLKFGKEEKLKSRKVIEHLFEEGKSAKSYPIIAVYDKVENSTQPIQVSFSVSKKKFKKAVDRNRVKRLLKESYRLNKESFINNLSEENLSMNLMFIYVQNEILGYDQMNLKLKKVLDKILKENCNKK